MQSVGSPVLWIAFIGFVLLMLALDLGVFHRKAHAVRPKEALTWSLVWIALSLCFNAFVWWRFGAQPGIEFLTGYLIEKSLSVDNIFVFVIVFQAMRIPAEHQHRVLFWGILSALVLRAVMIFAGTAMLARFEWLIIVFGAFLIFTGVKLFLHRSEEDHPEEGKLFQFVRRVVPTTRELHGGRFLVRMDGRTLATPLLLTLVLVEVTDVIFALDSIPAIFGITRDPFIVFTSNIFAILGLRSLYFLLAGAVEQFSYLKVGLSVVLTFVGVKMIVAHFGFHLNPFISLGVIGGILLLSILASIMKSRRELKAAANVPLEERT